MMSPTFADELIAKLPRDLLDTGRVRFVNIDEDLAFLVDFVIAGRRLGLGVAGGYTPPAEREGRAP